MASRHIRRVMQQREKGPSEVAEDECGGSEEEAEEQGQAVAAVFNPYECLTLEEEEDGEEEEPLAAKPDFTTCSPADGLLSGPLQSPQRLEAHSSNKKKPKRGGKRKANARQKDKSSTSRDDCKTEDDIDKLVEELNLQTAEPESVCAKSVQPAAEPRKHLLAIKAGSLRAEEELYRIFGAKVVAAGEARLRQQRDRKSQRAPKGVRGVRRAVRSFWLTEVQEHWPALDGGLSMEYEDEDSGNYRFRYVYSARYRQVQAAFEQHQSSADPNTIAALLQRCPYHVESLLAMHDLYQATGEHLYAEELLNRCLYALERAWHPWFNPARGTCKLSFKVRENRPFFVSLFRHIQTLSRRSCLNTALECCKLLFSLDDGDPMGAGCLMDYLAIRTGRYDFVQRLADYDGDGSSIALLPGMTFSVALAKFKSQNKRASHSEKTSPHSSSATPIRDEPGMDQPSSDESLPMLVNAILLYPIVVVRLTTKLKEKGVSMDKEWSAVMAHSLFTKADDGGSASLNHLVNIFVERHHPLWKPPNVMAWLKEGCLMATDQCDGESTSQDGVTPEDWACVRSQAFPPTKVNEYRHLHLYDFSDDIPQLPAEELREAMDGGRDELQAAMAAMEQRMAEGLEQDGQQGVRQLTEEELQNSNPLMTFLRSLLPWVQAGRQSNGGPALQPRNPDDADQG